MTATTYDIFELAKDLKEANISEKAIDAIVKFERTKEQTNNDNLATKKDLAIVKRDIILALVVLIPAIMKILEHYKF